MTRYEVTVPYMQVDTAVVVDNYFGNCSWSFHAELPDGTNMEGAGNGGFGSEDEALMDALTELNATLIEDED